MPLNLPRGGTTSFNPPLRYVARSGVWVTRDPLGVDREVYMHALWDAANIWTGWLAFRAGAPPDLIWDQAGVAAERPSKDHRRGLSCLLLSHENLFGVRDLTANAGGLCGAVVRVYEAYEAAPERANGLLPIIECTDLEPVEGVFGSFFDPRLEIVGCEQRPPELPLRRVPPTPVARSAVAPAGASTALARSVRDELDDDIPF